MQRPMAKQKRITLGIIGYGAGLAIADVAVAPRSTTLALATALWTMAFAAVTNRHGPKWYRCALALTFDPPSKTVARMAVRLAAWAIVGDLSVIFLATSVIWRSVLA